MPTECANEPQSKSVMNPFRMQLRRSCLDSDVAGHGLYPIQLLGILILPIPFVRGPERHVGLR